MNVNLPATIGAAIALALLAAPSAGETELSLRPADRQDPAVAPYQPAELTIVRDDADPRVVGGLRIRWIDGGPVMEVPAVLPPGRERTVRVHLPAISVRQTYRVELLADRNGRPIAGGTAEIDWPAERVTRDAFIAPGAYRRWEYDRPLWPGGVRRWLMILAGLTAATLAGTLLIRRPRVRGLAVAGVLCVSAGAIGWALAGQRLIVERGDGTGRGVVLTARRTAQWRSSHAGWAPVYYGRWQLPEESLVLRPDDGATLTLRPDEVRILRRVGQSGAELSEQP